MFGIVGSVGLKTRLFFKQAIDILFFAIRTLRALSGFRKYGFGSSFQVVLKQILFTGVQAVPILSFIALILGSIAIVQSLPQLLEVGASEFVGIILVISIIRELGPLFTAIIVISRSGTAIAAELGTNKVLQEYEALEVMGINPFNFMVVPRVLGVVISMACLLIYFDIVALVGGFLVAKFKLTMPFSLYIRYIFEALTPIDIYISLSKSVFFGMIIAIFCCYHGLRAQRATTEIPQVVARGVMQSVLFVSILSGAISVLFYLR